MADQKVNKEDFCKVPGFPVYGSEIEQWLIDEKAYSIPGTELTILGKELRGLFDPDKIYFVSPSFHVELRKFQKGRRE